MVAQPAELVREFRLNLGEERAVRRVERAREHEVVPHQQPKLVTGVVKSVVFKLASAPQPDHVHVGGPSRPEQVAVALGRLARGQPVAGNPVRALAEQVHPVDAEGHAHAGFGGGVARVWLVDDLDGAQAEAARERVLADRHGKVVERLLARPVGPPQPGLFDGDLGRDPVAAGRESHRHARLDAAQAHGKRRFAKVVFE
ncbi:MAG: hypothetical protein BWY37_02240 [Firmicutes bacterium ADurb.Bin262]|nr:MAG: hypothetical protein BWY37_02240 [Firmicutes bacterium ADurb.Bin262]